MECRFAARTLESDGLDLVAVKTAREGPLSPTVLFFLKTYGLGQSAEPARAACPAGPIWRSSSPTRWRPPRSMRCWRPATR